MIFAYHEGVIRRAAPGLRGTCPFCEKVVIAKCGTILIWHWAHLPDEACSDSWAEESAWHLAWKQWAVDLGWRVEFPIARDDVRHRADIVTPSGWVIELQHSPLDARQIDARERFYGRVVWIWDMNGRWERFNFRSRNGRVGFRWRRPMWSLCAINRPLFLDFGDDELLRAKVDRKPSRYGDYDVCVGYGSWGSSALLVRAFGQARDAV